MMVRNTATATKTRYLVFRPGLIAPEELAADLPEDPGYDVLRDMITPILGGPLEHVAVLYENERRDMFVHETGILDGLPRNETATAIYRANWIKRYPKTDPESLNFIAGPAVLFPDAQIWF